MATGDTLLIFTPLNGEPPASAYATQDTRNSHPTLDFDDTAATEAALFTFVVPRQYAGGGLTVYLHWAATSATTGNVMWQTSFERISASQQDTDADGFATAITWAAAATDATASGNVVISSQAHLNSQIDGLLVGELGRIKIERLGSNASDTMTGDAELMGVEIKET